jgi:hypothetical protein
MPASVGGRAEERERVHVIKIGWRYQMDYKCRRAEVPCLGNNKAHLYLLDVVIDSCPVCHPEANTVLKRTTSRNEGMAWYVVADTVRFEEVQKLEVNSAKM